MNREGTYSRISATSSPKARSELPQAGQLQGASWVTVSRGRLSGSARRAGLAFSTAGTVLADGEAKFDDLERQLAEGPAIGLPTITMEGDANGAVHADPSAYAGKFTGKYEHRTLDGGIGHNLSPEAPQAFADAIVAVARF